MGSVRAGAMNEIYDVLREVDRLLSREAMAKETIEEERKIRKVQTKVCVLMGRLIAGRLG